MLPKEDIELVPVTPSAVFTQELGKVVPEAAKCGYKQKAMQR
jgi:hypothetical protein